MGMHSCCWDVGCYSDAQVCEVHRQKAEDAAWNAALEAAAAIFDAEARSYAGKHAATIATQNSHRIRALKRTI